MKPKSGRLIFLISAFALFVCDLAAAKNRAIVFGGNCERGKASNMFQETIADVSGGFRKQGWDVVPLFDGSEWRTVNVEQQAGKPVQSASKEKLIDALKNSAGDLAKDDQLMVSISTHGSYGHAICMSDGASMAIDDKDFLAALDVLKSKGVKLAFSDASCYGGGSVPVLSKYGCVVSTQSDNRVSWGTGVNSRLAQMLNAPQSYADSDLGKFSDGGDASSLEKPDGALSMENLFLDTLLNYPSKQLGDVRTQAMISGFDEASGRASDFTRLLVGTSYGLGEPPSYETKLKVDGIAACTSYAGAFSALTGQVGQITDASWIAYCQSLGSALTSKMFPVPVPADLVTQIEDKQKKLEDFSKDFADAAQSQQKALEELGKWNVEYAAEYDLNPLLPPDASKEDREKLVEALSDAIFNTDIGEKIHQGGMNIEGYSGNLFVNRSASYSAYPPPDWSDIARKAAFYIKNAGVKDAGSPEFVQRLERIIAGSEGAALDSLQKKLKAKKIPFDTFVEKQGNLAKLRDRLVGDEAGIEGLKTPLNYSVAQARFYDYIRNRERLAKSTDPKDADAKKSLKACSDFRF